MKVSIADWLLSIAHNLSVDYIKKRVRERSAVQRLPHPGYDKLDEGDLLIDQIADRLRRESEALAHIFVLRVDEGLLLKEIASIVSIPERTVRRHMDTIRAIISQEFAEFLDAGGTE